MKNQGYNAYDFTLDSVGITPLTDGAETVEIAPLVLGFKYYEDITTGFVSANLMIVDSGINVRGNLPIVNLLFIIPNLIPKKFFYTLK